MVVNSPMENQQKLSREDKSTNTKQTKKNINKVHGICGHLREAALWVTIKSLPLDLMGNIRPCNMCAKAKAQAKSV